jgi:hypothetical protein
MNTPFEKWRTKVVLDGDLEAAVRLAFEAGWKFREQSLPAGAVRPLTRPILADNGGGIKVGAVCRAPESLGSMTMEAE